MLDARHHTSISGGLGIPSAYLSVVCWTESDIIVNDPVSLVDSLIMVRLFGCFQHLSYKQSESEELSHTFDLVHFNHKLDWCTQLFPNIPTVEYA